MYLFPKYRFASNDTNSLSALIPLLGFETNVGANETDFFGTFDKVVASSGNDVTEGFDAAFDATAWGDAGKPQDTDEGQLDAPSSGEDVMEAVDGNDDALKKDRSRAKRGGTSGSRGVRSSRPPTSGVEAAVDAINISDGGDGSKDRRSRPSKPESGRAGSSSRSSRREKPRSSRGEKNEGESDELVVSEEADKKTAPAKGNSFKKMFSRGKAPAPDP